MSRMIGQEWTSKTYQTLAVSRILTGRTRDEIMKTYMASLISCSLLQTPALLKEALQLVDVYFYFDILSKREQLDTYSVTYDDSQRGFVSKEKI